MTTLACAVFMLVGGVGVSAEANYNPQPIVFNNLGTMIPSLGYMNLYLEFNHRPIEKEVRRTKEAVLKLSENVAEWKDTNSIKFAAMATVNNMLSNIRLVEDQLNMLRSATPEENFDSDRYVRQALEEAAASALVNIRRERAAPVVKQLTKLFSKIKNLKFTDRNR